MNLANKYLDLNDSDIDILLMGLNVESENENESKNKRACVNCKSTNLILDTSNGYRVCQDCGVINKEFLDESPEFGGDKSQASRYGCPTNYYYQKSALGTKIKTRGYSRIGNLQKQGQMPYKEKSLMETLKKIQKKCKDHSISQPIIDNAKNLYKKVDDSKHKKGKRKGKSRIMRCDNRKAMLASCVFYACKMHNDVRCPKEIADIYDLDIKTVNRGIRKFLEYVNIEELMIQFKSSQSSDFIERFSKKLDIKENYIKIAKDISENIHKLDLASTHEPPSVAAGCILLVVNMYHLDKSKKEISDVFNISDVTISKTYRRIHPYHKIITNNKITELVLQKMKSKPKKESDINKDNLVMTKDKYLSESEDSISESSTSEEQVEIKKKKRGRKKNNFIEI